MKINRVAGAGLVPFIALLMLSSEAFAQCSTDSWSGAFGSAQARGEATSPKGKKYEQSCGLTVDFSTNPLVLPAYVTTDTPSDETVISARFYLLQEALDLQSGDLTLLKARDGSTVEFELLIRSTGSVNHLVSRYHDGVGLTEDSEIIALQNVWQAVEVAWSAGAGDGTFELKIDDISQFARTNLTNGGAVINEIDFGAVNDTFSATGELVLDAIDVRRAGAPGLLDISELRNISTRADVGTGDNRVIGGFIIEGDTDKCVVVRGRGPSVDVAPDIRHGNPTLTLKSGTTTIDSNDNWGDSPEAAIITNLGLAPGSPLDAAIYACIPPGPYTAILATVGLENVGVGIVEVYDADVGTPFLGNISTRAPVGAGDLRAIGGFIVEGTLPKQILIRARGPTVGVSEELRLPNPRLRLFDSGGEIEVNDNWGDASNSAAISATGLAPTNPNESAILIELNPGPYTAIVNAVGGTGIGIVEVYDLSGGVIAPQ